MNEPIFREKSLQKVKSPDNLNEYIRVANPGVWTIMVAIIFLLIGFCVWTMFGTLSTSIKLDAHCDDGVITCYLTEDSVSKVQSGMAVQIGEITGTIADIDLNEGAHGTCTVETDETLPDGIYDVEIIVEAIHPAVFLTN